ncbi:hypothetical protein Tco_0180248 [Tanacetum coccineum]
MLTKRVFNIIASLVNWKYGDPSYWTELDEELILLDGKGVKEIAGLMLMGAHGAERSQRKSENLMFFPNDMLSRSYKACGRRGLISELVDVENEGAILTSSRSVWASLGKKVNELHAMLKLHEQTLPKNNAHCSIMLVRGEKVQKAKFPSTQEGDPANDFNSVMSENTASGAGVVQGLRASRKLKPGALSLYVGNGQREAVEAIGNFELSFPSGLVIV